MIAESVPLGRMEKDEFCRYHSALTAHITHDDIQIAVEEEICKKGKGLVTKKALSAGQRIFEEAPLVRTF
jgi:hypothetical protein